MEAVKLHIKSNFLKFSKHSLMTRFILAIKLLKTVINMSILFLNEVGLQNTENLMLKDDKTAYLLFY